MIYKYDVVVLTEDRYENPLEITPYVNNVLIEDALLVNALSNKGLSVGRFSWSNKSIDWKDVKSVVFRTTWDYFRRFEEFENWLKSIQGHVRMFNPSELIFWNMDKSYLEFMRERGIAIPATYFIKKGDERTLRQITNELPYKEYILKPNVSGAARHTYKLNDLNIDDHEDLFELLIGDEPFMIQEFQWNILTRGEISLIIIDGKFTHAVLKQSIDDDFRVQDDFGGTVEVYHPKEEEIAFAEACIAVLVVKPLYARVDLMWDNHDKLVLSEMEMIEPELWFRNCPEAAMSLASAVRTKLEL
jgi:glutathione synthase/RimK-type ligase-like ATP-grasp enzyme